MEIINKELIEKNEQVVELGEVSNLTLGGFGRSWEWGFKPMPGGNW